MRGYGYFSLRNKKAEQEEHARETRELFRDYRENDLYLYEAERYFRLFVTGSTPTATRMRGDCLFRGKHVLDLETGKFPAFSTSSGELTNSTNQTNELKRFRYRWNRTALAPAPPNQHAFALGRISTFANSNPSPTPYLSSIDINLKRIGNVFGHPAGRRAFHNETAIVPAGVGVLTPSGEINFGPGEEFAYVYDVRIKASGNETGATYVWKRRPYMFGSYEAGAGAGDVYVAAGSDNGGTRFNGARVTQELNALIADSASPSPPQMSYLDNYPTAAGVASVSRVTGLAFDGLQNGRIWWCICDNLASSDANASRSRSIWTWKRMTGEAFKRADTVLTGFPALPTSVQFRDLKAARGGFVFVAGDGNDNANTSGSDNGALIQINPKTNAVIAVAGTTAGGIYTQGGLAQNNILGIAIDSSETHAASGFDRVWVLHRNGLSFADMNITTGALGSWSRVGIAGSGFEFTTIASGSEVGVGGTTLLSGETNCSPALLDVDSDGNVYWYSISGGTRRLNRITGAGVYTHSHFSLATAAEGGALGFMVLGDTTNIALGSMRIHRRDPGDPEADDIWVSAGNTDNTAGLIQIRQIPATHWVAGNNPGFEYNSTEYNTTSANNRAIVLHLAPGGGIWASTTGIAATALLEPNGRKTVVGVGTTLAGGPTTWTLTASSSIFTTAHVGKAIHIRDAQNAANNGRWKIASFVSGTQVTITNPSGAAESSSTMNLAIPVLDTDSSGSQNSWSNGINTNIHFVNAFIDDSGIAYFWGGRNGGSLFSHQLNTHMAVGYQWDSGGSQWYRSLFPNTKTAVAKTAHTAQEALASGVTVNFDDGAGGPQIFVADEYYTFHAAQGLVKEATQELTWGYDLYNEKTELVTAEGLTSKTAQNNTVEGGFIGVASLTNVLTDNPFTAMSAGQKLQIGHYQRELALNGSNGTIACNYSGTINATNGVQLGVDLGSDVVAGKLRFCISAMHSGAFSGLKIDLYSATAGAGPASWTLRSSYSFDADSPGWLIRQDVDRSSGGAASPGNGFLEFESDLQELLGGGNTAQRYWKMAIYGGSGSSSGSIVGANAFDTSGIPIGMGGAHRRLDKAVDTDYLANTAIRGVFVQDEGTGGTAARGPSNNQVTLTGDTFTNCATGDKFRLKASGTGDSLSAPDEKGEQLLTDAAGAFVAAHVDALGQIIIQSASNPENIGTFKVTEYVSGTQIKIFNPDGVSETSAFSWDITAQERQIATVDSGTQITLTADIPNFSAQDWEVVRNADIRPRDDEGGSEDQARFPSAAGEVFICPITGMIFYHADDVTASRAFRILRYIKVKRSA